MTDIVKIQKTIRKAIKDYAIAGNHEEEVLISLMSVDLYLSLEDRDTPPPSKPRHKPLVVPPVIE